MPRMLQPSKLPSIPDWIRQLPDWVHSLGNEVSVNPIATPIPSGTVYHGTTVAFKNFKPSPKGTAGLSPQWTHFSEDPEWANRFAKGFSSDRGARVIPAKLPKGEYIDLNDMAMNFDDLARLKSTMSPNQLKQFNFFSGYPNSTLNNILRNMLEADPGLFRKSGFSGVRYLDAGNPAWAFDPKRVALETPWGTPLTSIGGK